MSLLTSTFLKKYQNLPFPGTPLGEFVYLRTYSRWIGDRREKWWETVARVVEYSFSLYSGHKQNLSLTVEAENLFDDIFNLRVFPAGRTLWLGGSKASEKHAIGNFNCAFVILKDIEAYCDLFYLLMVGTGVGFRVLLSDVMGFPKFYKTNVIHAPYQPKPKSERLDNTMTSIDGETQTIVVGDSKEGWVDAVRDFLVGFSNHKINEIIIDYNNVRPRGEKLVTFGGRASGPDGLSKLFVKSAEIINAVCEHNNGTLRTVDAMDIANLIGEAVVVGGVRRTSEITLFDINDNDILDAKLGLYTEGSTNYGLFHRSMSNNSIYFTKKPSLETIRDILNRTAENGEPGFINAEAASLRRPNFQGINPCITGDTIILTKEGERRVLDLVDKPFVAVVDTKEYPATGFWFSGNKPVYQINTKEGYTLKLTLDHKVLTKNGWTHAYDLIPGDEIRVNSTSGMSKPAFRKWATVIDLTYQGMKDVYDCTVEEIHCFSANNLIAHNCAEILLDDKGLCNLSTVNCMADIKFYSNIDSYLVELQRRIRAATKIGVRQTNVDIGLPAWDKVQKRDRLIGVSLTGWMDMVDYWNIDPEQQMSMLQQLRSIVDMTSLIYAKELRIPAPLLATCVKPEGSISQLPTVSSGVHRSFAPYYIRRVRISAHDPLARVMSELNYPIYPESSVINPEKFDSLNPLEQFSMLEAASTWVIEFPVASQSRTKASEETALEQLNRYLMFQRHYSQHNTSITITVGPNEWGPIADAIYTNWDDFVGVSLLPKDTNAYPLMPYEAISEQEYLLRKDQIKNGNIEEKLRLAEAEFYETADSELDPSCENGVCPPR